MARFINAEMVNPHKEVDRTQFPFTLPVFREFQSLAIDSKVTCLWVKVTWSRSLSVLV